MQEETQPALRLAGICKKCREFRFGYLLYGRGPFVCYQCAEATAKSQPTDQGSTSSFTFTVTSNDSTSNWEGYQ